MKSISDLCGPQGPASGNFSSSIRRPRADKTGAQSTSWEPAKAWICKVCNARFDKVSVRVELGNVESGSPDDLTSFRFHLGGPPAAQQCAGAEDQFSHIYCVAPNVGATSRPLEVRSRETEYAGVILPPPLWGGQLFVSHGSAVKSRLLSRVHARFDLNPSRAINHLGDGLAKPQVKTAGPLSRKHKGIVRGLCGNDNVVPQGLTGQQHDKWTLAYIEGVLGATLHDIRRAAKIADDAGAEFISANGTGLNSLSLRYAETYWEYPCCDAVALVHALEPVATAYGREVCSRLHPCETAREGNCRSITIRLSNAEEISIYAKTQNSVRLEVRHKPPGGNLLPGGYQTTSVDGFVTKLRSLREKAAGILNGFLAFLRERPSIAPQTPAVASRYAARWGDLMGAGEPSLALLALFQAQGSVRGGACVECIPEADKLLRKARDAGLIRHAYGAYFPVHLDSCGKELTHLDNEAIQLGPNIGAQTAPAGSVTPSFSMPASKRERSLPSPPENNS